MVLPFFSRSSRTFNFTGTGVFGDEFTLYLDGQDVQLYQVSWGDNILNEYISAPFQLEYKLLPPTSSDDYNFEFILMNGYLDQGNSYYNYNILPVSPTLSNKNETNKTAKLTCTLNIPFSGPGFVQL